MRKHADKIYVYDRFVRFFHWNLVVGIIAAKVTAENDADLAHSVIGYYLLALLVLRVFWGFCGSKYARFSSFKFTPSQVFQYLIGLFGGKPRDYATHNPASAYMAFALMALIIFSILSGIFVYAYLDYSGPLGFLSPFLPNGLTALFRTAHEMFFIVLAVFIFTHITGAILSSVMHKRNLIKSILTGYRKK